MKQATNTKKSVTKFLRVCQEIVAELLMCLILAMIGVAVCGMLGLDFAALEGVDPESLMLIGLVVLSLLLLLFCSSVLLVRKLLKRKTKDGTQEGK